MTTPDDRRDARLAELVSSAVSDIEPADRLDSIRNRAKVTPMSARRPWIYAVGGAVVATAAVVTAIALAGGDGPLDRASDENPPATQEPADPTSAPAEPTPSEPTEPEESESPSAPGGAAVPVYFVSEQPQGLRLFREFHSSGGGDAILESATASVEGDALDPDYRSLWPAGSSVASVDAQAADVVVVDVTGAPHDRPAALSEDDAALALQQLVYSVQAAYGERVGVQVLLDGERTDAVLGQPVSEPLTNAPILETLSMMQINSPNEGDTFAGDFTATGANNSFEATVLWKLMDGEEAVAQGFGTAEGWGPDRLYAWSVEVDVSGVEPGSYTLVLSNDDPSGGAEGAGPQVDTRTITLVG